MRRGARSRSPSDGRRLGYICHIFPYLTQTFVYREVEELRRAGIPLTVFSMKPAIPARMSEESRYLEADTVYLPPVTGAAVLISQIVWLIRSPRRYLQALALVARGAYRFNNTLLLWLHGLVDFARGAHLARLLTRDGSFCHLYAQFADDACTTTMIASMLAGIEFSFRSHTSPNPQIIGEKVRRARFVAAASRYDKRVLVHWCGERVSRKIYVNRLGVPLDRYVPDSGVQAFGRSGSAGDEHEHEHEHDLNTRTPERPNARTPERPNTRTPERPNARTPERPNTRPLILSVGTLIPEKGFEYVIRACRILADRGFEFDCLIVGDGPDRARLEDLVALLGLGEWVTLAPYRPQEEVRHLFQQAAVFTLPCIFPLNGNVDVIPLVLQEAMAMARPVVSTPVSGIPELIQDGVNGLLAPEKDDEALARSLARLLCDPERARRLGAAARRTVMQHFNVATNAAALAEIFRREVPELGRDEGRGMRDEEQQARSSSSLIPHPSSLIPSLRVAWVAEIPVPYRIGLYRRLRDEAGLDLKLFFCARSQADRDWQVSLEGIPHVVLRGLTAAVRPREQFFLRINPRIGSELSRFRPDVVVVGGYAHVTMQWAMLWCRRTGTPYIINSETHFLSGQAPVARRREGQGLSAAATTHLMASGARRLASALKRFFIRGAAAGLPAGTLAREYLVAHGGPAGRMFLMPNTCPVERFARESACARSRRAALRAELGLGPGPVVLAVGRLTPVKGLDTLLRAFAHPGVQAFRRSGVQAFGTDKDGPDFECVEPERLNARTPERLNTERLNAPSLLLLGDGEQREELEALAVKLGVADQVCFAGSRAWDELPALYGAADLFVLPSTFEPWGAVVPEAMSCGLPVVVADRVGCAPDLVRPGENGWVVPAGDAGALAQALREALADPTRLAAMGAASARVAAAWGEDACLTAFVAAVHAAMGVRCSAFGVRSSASGPAKTDPSDPFDPNTEHRTPNTEHLNT